MLSWIVKCKVYPRTGHEGPEGEQRYSSNLSLTSALAGGGWLTPRPVALPLGKRRDTNLTGGWVGLDGCGKHRPYRNSIPGSSSM